MPLLTTRAPPQSLADWLEYIDRVHPLSIDLGLERVNHVKKALGLAPSFPVITVGGTNGKGSTCALLETILAGAGYRVGCYTSPHLLHFRERVRVDRREVSDLELCRAFAAADAARGDIPLTYFEFGTLGAMSLFIDAKVDVAVLEVGLGGRLDAVNAFDADCAVIASVDLDHMDYLGETREDIAFEKARIFRAGRPAVCADPDVPDAMLRHAADINARFVRIGQDFGPIAGCAEWQFWGRNGVLAHLPYPALYGAFQLQNASGCLAVLDEMRLQLPVTVADVRRGLVDMSLPGRFQILPGSPTVILDVAHNPHAARALAGNLRRTRNGGLTYAVFAMLKDKDIRGVIRAVESQIDVWLAAGIQDCRGASAEDLCRILGEGQVAGEVSASTTPTDGFARAYGLAGPDDRIVVFGSFHTVAAVMRSLGLTADLR
jgi:dihydrofolate synthase / folylpolyglutamate synthase